MSPIISLLSFTGYFNRLETSLGWLGWFALLFAVLVVIWRGWHYHHRWSYAQWVLLVSLLIFIPATTLFLGLRLPAGSALTLPGLPLEPQGPALMIFAALPWILAAGFLGPAPAGVFAALSGLILGYFDTHSPFTPLEFALIAVLFSAAVNQRYRTFGYGLLRRPLIAALTLSLLYPILYVSTNILLLGEAFNTSLSYALSRVVWVSVAMAGQLLVAAFFAEVIAIGLPMLWYRSRKLVPSPAERSLEIRLLNTMTPLVILLAVLLLVGDWVLAGQAAERMLQDRMQSSAEIAAESLPFILETGQSLITQWARDPRLLDARQNRQDLLTSTLRQVTYFHQLMLLDESGSLLAVYPGVDLYSQTLTDQEELGLSLAFSGVTYQSYTTPPASGEDAAQLSFLAAVPDSNGQTGAVLLGRSSLATNPFTEPILENLSGMADIGGVGMLLDGDGNIIYHPSPDRLLGDYSGRIPEAPVFTKEPGPDGTLQIVYYRPLEGFPWAVVISIPATQPRQVALDIAVPLLGLLAVLALIAFAVLRLGLRVVTVSLQRLAEESGRIARGHLDSPLPVRGADEVGRLGLAFEQMRVSLKSRLDEMNRLLFVSQGVASSLDMEAAVEPILEAAMTTGASSARLVLASNAIAEFDDDRPTRYGRGSKADAYSGLDNQILRLTRRKDRVVLTNPARTNLYFDENTPPPAAILALSLYHEKDNFGALWVAHDRPHKFTNDELRFMSTVAGQAALAAANARLFLSAQVGRQRMEAILASSPDPVLVTDYQNHLLLANPAAWHLLGHKLREENHLPIEEYISQKELLDLLSSSDSDPGSAEIELEDNRTYFATASPILADGQQMGRVCVLRDITRFKELETLKSDFVSTVSHDLRSPLTLMRGYATMLQMVGGLNEQQMSYVHKINNGIERMTNLINNLLDLGRIEAGIGLKLEMVRVVDLAQQVVEGLQLQAAQKQMDLAVEDPKQPMPMIQADPALLQQALHNLVENAIKYTERGGKVRVKLSAHKDGVLFVVSDTGIGIAPVDQPRLFERFYRTSRREARKQRGSGLGLAIVKSIAERHGGRVWVESQLGQGSNFYLSLPLRQPEDFQKR